MTKQDDDLPRDKRRGFHVSEDRARQITGREPAIDTEPSSVYNSHRKAMPMNTTNSQHSEEDVTIGPTIKIKPGSEHHEIHKLLQSHGYELHQMSRGGNTVNPPYDSGHSLYVRRPKSGVQSSHSHQIEVFHTPWHVSHPGAKDEGHVWAHKRYNYDTDKVKHAGGTGIESLRAHLESTHKHK